MIGGAICAVGQVILDCIKSFGFSKEFSSNFTSMAMIFLGSFLTAFNVYDKIAEYGKSRHAGADYRLANSIVSAAMEFKSEGYILGLGAKMFTVAGPVLVFGAISSVVSGIIYYIFLKC
ncbi:MAG: SpoVA/SpoVAEb family sporulation membrane protein [Clostridiales bacterium]|nr:MAG: SpoVA/SpoVAEb family sporulation membrane protein [Clostridiales bacterium]